MNTLPEANVAPENQWLENEISFWGRLFFRGWAGESAAIGRSLGDFASQLPQITRM